MFYLASGYEDRVGEVFESRVTRLNAWKGARVQRMHVRARMGAGAEHWNARACALGCLALERAHGRGSGARAWARTGVWRAGAQLYAQACARACSDRQREQLTLKPVMQMWSQRCPRRSKLDFSDCFLSCLGAPEIPVIFICRDLISKDLKSVSETFKALLGRSR
ncbi:hypothetical protein CRG98_038150 [Punica granatum]|uniref:Uncharacterized protein n=1 Tax=Punica granatum TaxID=22663 RepID=A0A2I0IBS2_PUNGR|nr:hypothetical protein CRG98_038150 [Punica granatum]